ncbi:type II toxin-antitoxin system PemK/MazF family toxin [Actinomyces bowdenii]|uniref:Type II toxin-antitoxin system PemK/MazF family toxin n=1 Tax=Actinomyces bowdenii TaxID=131109 RepID=A0A853EM62_9ACTO|nr:type II toxin-antitoxin system PemK/MazF family toxin [Actinomyces bowdenii]MBF0698167.1 type II toxin-antitoxin system PemK/MazF family toxin [Actinomyces bowdenii]NYS70339.1 type II toxin-antitoxin system PemK/MazF family toxin [Actinomyces bowdenii]
MASLLNRILRVLGRAAADAASEALTTATRPTTTSSGSGDRPSTGTSSSSGKADSGSKGRSGSPSPRGTDRPNRSRGADNGARGRGGAAPHRGVAVYDVAALGLPDFTYSPDPDGDADPGEVVWTWVPYEEDAARGKDRPVLVLARAQGRLVVAQMTSKDHDRDAAQEARWGRHWHDVGSGPWDARGRPSEVRLDRLLSVEPGAVRREGATMPRGTFEAVVAALRAHHS